MTDGSQQGKAGDEGVVLVVVLWLLALLGGLTMAMSTFMTATLSGIDLYADRPRAAAAVLAGLNRAVADVLADGNAVRHHRATLTVADARIAFAATAESARIDVNVAPAELLAGLFANLGAPRDAAAAYAQTIVALRGLPSGPRAPGQSPTFDPDEETPEGIARAARGGQPRPGEADPHKPFVDAVQLQQIQGLPPGLMALAAPFLTTYSGIAQIDASTAAPEIVAALPGMTTERVRSVMALRGRTFRPEDLADALGPAASFTTTKPVPATRIAVQATLRDGFAAAAEVVVVHFPDDTEPYRVVAWDETSDRHGTLAKDAP